MKEYSVIFNNVSKTYKLKRDLKSKLKSLVFSDKFVSGEVHHALKNVSIKIEKGDVVGLIGKNGAGKSTFSNLLMGATSPTTGTIEIKGTVSLIAISSGLKGELTGRENIQLKLMMLGYSPKTIKKIEPTIIGFSEVGKFIDQPLKSYSSGMKSRLGFAISVHINPDILIIDEALSVGDQHFYQKCFNKINEFKEKGKTIFFVSHSMSQVKSFCHHVLWLENGQIKRFGLANEVIKEYQEVDMG